MRRESPLQVIEGGEFQAVHAGEEVEVPGGQRTLVAQADTGLEAVCEPDRFSACAEFGSNLTTAQCRRQVEWQGSAPEQAHDVWVPIEEVRRDFQFETSHSSQS